MTRAPWDQRLARVLVRPLAGRPVTPNHITAASLFVALAAAGLFASGDAAAANWGAGLFVLARFLDHFDGELARLTGASSRFGYYFDYAAGAISYAALFAALGIGLSGGALGGWALLIAAAGAASALIAAVLNLDLDRQTGLADGESVGYPGVAGFELEDGIYLIAPITWLGWLTPFFVACGVGATAYCARTALVLLRTRAAKRP